MNEQLIKSIEEYTKQNVKPKRYEHCCRVAKMCVQLCNMFNISEEKGYIAGIGHDMCKDFPAEKLIELSQMDGKEITDYERNNFAVLHGRAASIQMEKKFGITDSEVLTAVRNHVYADYEMPDLAKILYISDKCEPGRSYSTDEYRESLFKLSLNDMFKKVLLESFEYVKKQGYEIFPMTQKIVDFYLGDNK